MKLQLINSPIDNNYLSSTRTGLYAPLNLATLSGFIKKHLKDIDIQILDGEIESLEILKVKVNAPIVGISCNIMTYKSALELAESAFNKGSKVILGGPFPGSMSELILKNRPFIDAIVDGDGEQALLDYIKDKPKNIIPNLVYRHNNKIIRNYIKHTNLSTLPMPDYSSLDMKPYFSNYKIRYGNYKPFNSSLAICSIKGCKWREATGGCIFCMIPNKGVNYCKPSRVWKEISYFHDLYGVDYFWDVSDSFVDNNIWLEDFALNKPKNLNIGFEIYGRANRITEKKAKLLKEIGVFEVFIGAESGDDEILKNINKGITTNNVLNAINYLAKFDIKVTVSFVVGLPGENKKSLIKTLRFAEKLASFDNIIETSTSMMLPIPGSRAFKNLVKDPYLKKKYNTDFLNLEELKNDWIKKYTNLNYNIIENASNEITNMFKLNSTFAQPKHEFLISPYC